MYQLEQDKILQEYYIFVENAKELLEKAKQDEKNIKIRKGKIRIWIKKKCKI